MELNPKNKYNILIVLAKYFTLHVAAMVFKSTKVYFYMHYEYSILKLRAIIITIVNIIPLI